MKHKNVKRLLCLIMTAVCAAAFARGVRLGLLSEVVYKTASEKCIEALKKYCVDKAGNVYGECCGFGY